MAMKAKCDSDAALWRFVVKRVTPLKLFLQLVAFGVIDVAIIKYTLYMAYAGGNFRSETDSSTNRHSVTETFGPYLPRKPTKMQLIRGQHFVTCEPTHPIWVDPWNAKLNFSTIWNWGNSIWTKHNQKKHLSNEKEFALNVTPFRGIIKY